MVLYGRTVRWRCRFLAFSYSAALSYTIQKLQCVSNNAARINLQAPRPSVQRPFSRENIIQSGSADVMFKVRSTSTPSYNFIACSRRQRGRTFFTICDTDQPPPPHCMCRPFTKTKRACTRCIAPAVCGTL